MEPKSSAASYALHTIMAKMPTRWEPAIGIIRSSNAQELHDHWQKVAAKWSQLQEQGKIKSFSTPAALALSPRRLEENRQKLQTIDLAGARNALTASVAEEGFSEETFASGFTLLDDLSRAAQPGEAVTRLARAASEIVELVVPRRSFLRAGSPALDRFCDNARADHRSGAEKMLARELPVAGVPMTLSGLEF